MDLRENGYGSVKWIQLVQVAGSCEYSDEPLGYGATELVVQFQMKPPFETLGTSSTATS
jgi:hypothetical protein